ncbi:MAG: hypothetical protein J7K65_03745 [Planctomycetes bacterium]|nr:hypothetical protein [Planctomycetota bacterium]
MDSVFDPAIEAFVGILDELKITYAIGGSVASSVYGQIRFTQDADISVAAFGGQIAEFCQAVESAFYVSQQAVQQAHHNASSFNVIYLDTAFKIDVFIVSDDPFKRQILLRREKVALEDSSDKMYDLVSPEDIILLKLQWYTDGGAVSQKQWNDILGVLENRQDKLDMDYLWGWASKLSVLELLNKAIQEAKD